MIFSPFVYLWNLISNRLLNRSSSSLIDQPTITRDLSALEQVKKAIQNKDLPSFNGAYHNLSGDGKKLLQNIYYQWVIKHTADAPYQNMDKYIKEHPFDQALASSCDKAADNLTKLLKIKPFLESLKTSTRADRGVEFDLLPHDLREGIKYTIQKVLHPLNNNDPNFAVTMIVRYGTTQLIKDVSTAAIRGLKNGSDHEYWYLEMPKGWE